MLPWSAAAANVLPEWRETFPRLEADLGEWEINLIGFESPYDALPALDPLMLERLSALPAHFVLGATDSLELDRIHGPETPFPDHYPLRGIAAIRAVLARHALSVGNTALALHLVKQNLWQARATLRGQEGLIPLIHGVGVWQCALDGVHALAQASGLSADEAAQLLAELLTDAELAQVAGSRALRGEFSYVYKVVVERLPVTDDPDLFLSAVGSLGMAPPEPLAPGEMSLGLTTHPLLDVPATLAAYEADLSGYLAALQKSSRLPRGLFARTTVATLGAYRAELGAFLAYASGHLPITLENVLAARIDMESTANPGGKVLAVFLTPAWESILVMTARREAQRAALCGLLGWRIHGGPTSWEVLVARGILPAPPADSFADGALSYSLGLRPRIWSVFYDGDLVWMP
ncbi:MAG: hypothetical protein EAZ36_07500 [Verrucomicrobia bacterium]|nr:MAG: hypothetical protein EAZ36_07500 [Verrucomicrobiota bacterium]